MCNLVAVGYSGLAGESILKSLIMLVCCNNYFRAIIRQALLSFYMINGSY